MRRFTIWLQVRRAGAAFRIMRRGRHVVLQLAETVVPLGSTHPCVGSTGSDKAPAARSIDKEQ
jgi:hypothetical protein